ncbi:DMT family transporter [Campylobacter hyointestinalis]|uniref:Integral membrane protein n=2 Tax=Campylobacter hyointestinalis subsp. hyointestinalis TaxID=91352 RepID=A0A9W5AMY7_CAMHY|nr:DMT family transporter [Campylobacter hyointestinalis]CUU75686.1 integral membrane protein [Campylobacter hyointestinalis subsp. hyointestinalis]CUU88511.1 integral membrane protein [Campylobacter hyointestinalis subsp. hyointestinalis]
MVLATKDYTHFLNLDLKWYNGQNMTANKNFFYFLLFLSMVAWGGSWVNMKILVDYDDPFNLIFIRFGIAAIAMIPIIYLLGHSFKIDLKSLVVSILAGICLISYMFCFYYGTKYGTASLGGAMVTTMIPIITFVILIFLRKRKAGAKDMFALFLGALGVGTMLNVWKFDMQSILAVQNLYYVSAAFLWAILTIISAKSKISPIVFTFYLYVMSSFIDAALFVKFDEIGSFDKIFWINMILISFGATVFANAIYFLGVEKLGAAEVSSFVFLVPFCAILLSFIFLSEDIKVSIVVGTVLTLWAVKLLNNIKIFKFKSVR